jgi:hypothetical protein
LFDSASPVIGWMSTVVVVTVMPPPLNIQHAGALIALMRYMLPFLGKLHVIIVQKQSNMRLVEEENRQ